DVLRARRGADQAAGGVELHLEHALALALLRLLGEAEAVVVLRAGAAALDHGGVAQRPLERRPRLHAPDLAGDLRLDHLGAGRSAAVGEPVAHDLDAHRVKSTTARERTAPSRSRRTASRTAGLSPAG